MNPSIDIQVSGLEKSYPAGITPAEILKENGAENPKDVVAASIDGLSIDLESPITRSGSLSFIDAHTREGMDILRHSAAHVMAQAVKELFPEVKVTIGPAVEDGFYYDFDSPRPFTPDDLDKIEGRMREIVKSKLPFRRMVMSKEKAAAFFEEKGEDYKVELVRDANGDDVSLYSQGEFTDLCRGPHVPHTGYIRAFKLMKVAGAYWRGDENNPMLQRIYGTAFPSKDDLKHYLYVLEEAKKRDHRKLAKELDLFSFHDAVGPGLVVWHPKGALLRHLVEDFQRTELLRRGYEMVQGPQILKRELWETSGHFDNYRENMYFTEVDEIEYGLKPMNCLAHMLIYKADVRSYRDLPIRYFEFGTVFRHEKSGVLHGLPRVRQFTQDDAHIICRPDQLIDEVRDILDFVRETMAVFGFEYSMELSTRPEKSIGTDEDWERATDALKRALDGQDVEYDINEGDGAFYGPKIDVKLRDALSREWQCSTIQCDFTLPERFDLTYVDSDGERKRPAMIHRAVLGSIERFIGILVEHYAGAFPMWLSPVQATVMTITDRHIPYAGDLAERLRREGVRVHEDLRNEKIGFKIREARNQRVPYMIVIGDQEMEHGTLGLRKRGENTTEELTPEEFMSIYHKEVSERT